ncbi:peroxidase family protein [Endozoicomonas arenosclerae]|uniref:peroxidase family protein n=1 Tax=Endozoicomonas arenosclerae TaxID=1633495 RepID=UPI0009A1D210|nr:peroxidase family protein [Endozoicomonas arenosclerae]
MKHSKAALYSLSLYGCILLSAPILHAQSTTETSSTTQHESTAEPPTSTSTPLIAIDHSRIRTYDGSQNNLEHPDYGKTHIPLARLPGLPASYADGIGLPIIDRPNARSISNAVSKQEKDSPDRKGLSNLFWPWGQLIDHDLDLTEETEEGPLTISNPGDPDGPSFETMTIKRSAAFTGTGEDASAPREQINLITGWLDGSMVYGSDEKTAADLRSRENGELRVNSLMDGVRTLLPQDDTEARNFVAGDIRAGENTALTCIHTLLMREHNRLAQVYALDHPEVDGSTPEGDEIIFQHSRKIVTAYIQKITLYDFLPALLGDNAIPDYESYNSSIQPDINNSFATAAYRFGHSAVAPVIPRLNSAGQTIAAGNLPVERSFFNSSQLTNTNNGGVDAVILGLASSRQQRIDTEIVDAIRQHLFDDRASDLPARNIARGRDHGLGSFNEVRKAMNMGELNFIEEISYDLNTQNKLKEAYNDDINKVDLWVGGLAETPRGNSLVGPVFHTIIKEQFLALRNGDRFWFENMDDDTNPDHLTSDELQDVRDTTLKTLIVRNTGIAAGRIPDNAFYVASFQPATRKPGVGKALSKLTEVEKRGDELVTTAYDQLMWAIVSRQRAKVDKQRLR